MTDAAIEAPPAPANGAEAPAAPTGTPPISIKIGTTPKGEKRPHAVGAEVFAALSENRSDTWTVTRLSAPGYPKATLGVLPITITADDARDMAALHARLGAGTYRFSSSSDPTRSYTVPLATRTPPVDFGTPAEEDDAGFIMTPNGPMPMRAMPANGMQFFNPGPWPAQPGSVAKDVVDALKPFLELQMKLLEKVVEKKDDHGDPKILLEIEKLKLEQAKEERKAREKEAEENRKARETELRERSAQEREAMREQAKAAAEAAKANMEASRMQSEAFSKAQMEASKAQLEAAKESTRAQIEAARERANAEKSMLDRYISMQKEMAESIPPQPTLAERIEELKAMQKMLGADGVTGTAVAVAREVSGILGQLIALKGTPIRIEQVPAAAPAAPAALPAPTAPPPAPVDTAEAAKRAEAEELKRQVLTGLVALEDGARRNVDPAKAAAVLKERVPKVHEWLRTAEPDAVLVDLEAMTRMDVFSEAERAKALGLRAALAANLAWLVNVLGAIKG